VSYIAQFFKIILETLFACRILSQIQHALQPMSMHFSPKYDATILQTTLP